VKDGIGEGGCSDVDKSPWFHTDVCLIGAIGLLYMTNVCGRRCWACVQVRYMSLACIAARGIIGNNTPYNLQSYISRVLWPSNSIATKHECVSSTCDLLFLTKFSCRNRFPSINNRPIHPSAYFSSNVNFKHSHR